MLPECILDPAKSQATPLETDFDPLARPAKLKAWGQSLTRSLTAWGADLFPDGWDFGNERITRVEYGRMVGKIAACASALELRAKVDYSTGEVGPYKVHNGNYCHSIANCPQCAARAQDVRIARFSEPIKALSLQFQFVYLLTLTLPPAETWREGLEQIRDAMKRFRRMGQKRTGRGRSFSRGEWGKVKAAIAKVELKRGIGSGMAHVHIHALIFCETPIDFKVYKEKKGADKSKWALLHPLKKWNGETGKMETVGASKLSLEWHQASGGKGLSIDCKRLQLRKEDLRKGRTYAEAVAAQAVEVLKYATKFDSSPTNEAKPLFVADFAQIKSATYGRRLFSTYGLLRGFGGSDFELPDEIGPKLYRGAFWDKEKGGYITREFNESIFKRETDSDRLKVLNGYLGRSRRRRSAIMRARIKALAGQLPEVISEELDQNKRPLLVEIPIPEYVAAAPQSPESWERFVDETNDRARRGYVALRESLRLEAEDPREWEKFLDKVNYQAEIKKPLWERGAAYWDRVVEAFQEVLNYPGRSLAPGYAYSS